MEALELTEHHKGGLRDHVTPSKWMRSARCETVVNGNMYLFVGSVLKNKCESSGSSPYSLTMKGKSACVL